LSGLLALLQRARLLVSNDTGPLHLASALGCPSVGIYWAMNVITAAPLVQGRQRAVLSMGLMCPVCGAENVRQRCPHQVSFVTDVTVDEVLAAALLNGTRGREGTPPPQPNPCLNPLALDAQKRSSSNRASCRTMSMRSPAGSHTARWRSRSIGAQRSTSVQRNTTTLGTRSAAARCDAPVITDCP